MLLMFLVVHVLVQNFNLNGYVRCSAKTHILVLFRALDHMHSFLAFSTASGTSSFCFTSRDLVRSPDYFWLSLTLAHRLNADSLLLAWGYVVGDGRVTVYRIPSSTTRTKLYSRAYSSQNGGDGVRCTRLGDHTNKFRLECALSRCCGWFLC